MHCEQVHLTVADWSLVWNELLTNKLPMFLSHLSEIIGGCEKIVPVSELFWSNLKFFKNDRFNCMVVRVKYKSEWNAVSVFLLSHLYCWLLSICWAPWWPAWTTETGYPCLIEKLVYCLWFFRKNQSCHYMNDKVQETVKKV